MNAYSYNRITKEYTGAVPCQPSPLEPGKYLMPANAVTVPSPEAEAGKAILWTGAAWESVPDYRGQTIYSKSSSFSSDSVKCPGTIPEDWTLIPPPDQEKEYIFADGAWTAVPPTLADYDAAMETHIRKACIDRGYTVREPDVYLNSGNERWRQDALDFIAFRDAVMEYGLEFINRYKENGGAPLLEDFIAGLPEISWTYGS